VQRRVAVVVRGCDSGAVREERRDGRGEAGAGGEHELRGRARTRGGQCGFCGRCLWRTSEERGKEEEEAWRAKRTASTPFLFDHPTQRSKRSANNSATAGCASAASMSGVSQSALREMPSSSWPASIR